MCQPVLNHRPVRIVGAIFLYLLMQKMMQHHVGLLRGRQGDQGGQRGRIRAGGGLLVAHEEKVVPDSSGLNAIGIATSGNPRGGHEQWNCRKHGLGEQLFHCRVVHAFHHGVAFREKLVNIFRR
jgi:hypothetical protein